MKRFWKDVIFNRNNNSGIYYNYFNYNCKSRLIQSKYLGIMSGANTRSLNLHRLSCSGCSAIKRIRTGLQNIWFWNCTHGEIICQSSNDLGSYPKRSRSKLGLMRNFHLLRAKKCCIQFDRYASESYVHLLILTILLVRVLNKHFLIPAKDFCQSSY